MDTSVYSLYFSQHTEFLKLCLQKLQIYYFRKRVFPKEGPKDDFVFDYDLVEEEELEIYGIHLSLLFIH